MQKIKWLYGDETNGSGDEIELVLPEMYQPPSSIRTQAGEYLDEVIFVLDEDSIEEVTGE